MRVMIQRYQYLPRKVEVAAGVGPEVEEEAPPAARTHPTMRNHRNQHVAGGAGEGEGGVGAGVLQPVTVTMEYHWWK